MTNAEKIADLESAIEDWLGHERDGARIGPDGGAVLPGPGPGQPLPVMRMGRASVGIRILSGELEALRAWDTGAGATIEGPDELILALERRYGVRLAHTRAKRAKAHAAGQYGDGDPRGRD